MKILSENEKMSIVKMYIECGNRAKVASFFKRSIKIVTIILHENNIFPSLRKQPLNIDYFKQINSPEKAYWLGFIVADGCLNKTKHKLSFCVKDPDILFKFQKAIGAGSPVRHRFVLDKRTNKMHEQYSLQINSKQFCQHVKNLGINENKSFNFTFPTIDEEYYSHFIRGLYDGDGSICIKTSVKKKQISYKINMISTLEGVLFIKNYFEKHFNWKVQQIFSKTNQGIHYLSMQKNAEKFLQWIYKDSTEETRLNRKYSKYAESVLQFESQYKILINDLTGEVHKVKNIRLFCAERGLNENLIYRTIHTGKSSSKGKHAGWRII